MKLTPRYHLTATQRRNIKAMMEAGLTAAKVNTMDLRIDGDKVRQLCKLESGGHQWEHIATISNHQPSLGV